MSLKFTEPEPGGGTYNMNNSVLKSELFQRTLESFWFDWRLKKEDFKNKLEWWEQIKVKIKSLTIEVSKQLHVTDKQVNNWENTLEKLLENNTDRENEITELRGKIQGFYEKKGRGSKNTFKSKLI